MPPDSNTRPRVYPDMVDNDMAGNSERNVASSAGSRNTYVISALRFHFSRLLLVAIVCENLLSTHCRSTAYKIEREDLGNGIISMFSKNLCTRELSCLQ